MSSTLSAPGATRGRGADLGVPPGRVLVAMSGGVDSSLAAAILHGAGFRVLGATMKTFCYAEVKGPSRSCCGLEGIADARSVADRLGVPHAVFDVEETFTADVIEDFAREYAAGRTPIPCVRCNSFTKFRDLVARADRLGCDYVATGHYARIDRSSGTPRLTQAVDEWKDQTYFLWGIPAGVLHRLLLPIGKLRKTRVRALAREMGLSTAEKPDSYEICFVPDGNYVGVLRARLGESHPALTAGPFLLADGTRVGEHLGYARFTVGQRRGLPGGFPEPMFVVEIRPESRAVVIGPRSDLEHSRLVAGAANWLAEAPEPGDELGVRIRHGAPVVPATVRKRRPDSFELEMAAPQQAITPGQSAVLYREEVLVGGGVIHAASR